MNILIVEDEINVYEYLCFMFKKIDLVIIVFVYLDSVEDIVNWLY